MFKFLELHEKVGFQDAVRMLAQKFGVVAARSRRGHVDDARRDAALREALLKMHEIAAAYFREQLAARGRSARAAAAAERGVNAETDRAARTRVRAAGPGRAEGASAEAGVPPGPAAAERAGRRSATTARSSIGSATG